MKIFFGLGNPGAEYANTYHNLGFMFADRLADSLGFVFKAKPNLKCQLAEGFVGTEKVIIVKPQTFMNLSGESVLLVTNYYKCELKDIFVCYDDVDLPIGQMRFRDSGSSGTHNGMRNIVALLNSQVFGRIRIGTKPDHPINLMNYVLSKITDSVKDGFDFSLNNAISCAKCIISGKDSEYLMCEFNGKKPQ